MRSSIFLLFVLSCSSLLPAQAQTLQHHNTDLARSIDSPYSEAVQVGSTLYLSGQIGNIPGSVTLVDGGVGPQTKQVLKNIKAILERNGSDLPHVAKCTVFLADINDWPAVNTIYRSYFHAPYPARSAIAAGGLPFGAAVEIECIAVRR
jgi:2-iminobutanoate/2-iminopropanoate deaminase